MTAIRPHSSGSGRAATPAPSIAPYGINTLVSRDELRALARTSGFEHQSTIDLSSALEIRRPRDRAINVLGAVADWLPLGVGRLDYLLGGSALQECLTRGWIGYELVVFRRLGPEFTCVE